MIRRSSILPALAAVTLAGGVASADPFQFSTTGSGTNGVTVNSFSEGAGNVLAVGAQTAIQNALMSGNSTSSTFTAYYQANITPVDSTNHAINVAPGQFTVVARFNEFATNISSTSATVNFALAANQAGSYFQIFYNPTAASNPLSGTGFATDSSTARLIYSGSIGTSNLGNFTNNGTGRGPDPANNNLDQVTYTSPNSSVQQSVSGNGGETFYINTASYDKNFFLTPIGMQTFSTTTDVAFHQTAASQMFIDLNPAIANADGSTPDTTRVSGSTVSQYITPHLPSINGLYDSSKMGSRQDFQFEAIASSSFAPFSAVPEPASMAMTILGLGVAGLGAARARRRKAGTAA